MHNAPFVKSMLIRKRRKIEKVNYPEFPNSSIQPDALREQIHRNERYNRMMHISRMFEEVDIESAKVDTENKLKPSGAS